MCVTFLFVIASIAGSGAHADVYLACSFETLPDIVTHYPEDGGEPTMQVGGRPSAPMTVGSGSNRFESATVDGYRFRFSPANSVVDVEREGKKIASEQGKCVLIGGPETQTALSISPDAETSRESDAQNTSATDIGKWDVSETTSNFDDTRTVVLRLQADAEIRNKFGVVGFPTMIMRCKENTTSLYFIMAGEFLSDIQGFGQVEYRIDDRPAGQKDFKNSTDNQALGLWRGNAAIPFIKSILNGSKLRIRVTPFNGSPTEVTFSIDGAASAVVPLREACSW